MTEFRMPRVGEVSTKSPHTIEWTDKLVDARTLMDKHNIRHLPVVFEGKLKTILSDRELNMALVLSKGEQKLHEILIKDVCTLDCYIADSDDALDKVLRDMVQQHIGSALVVERGKLVGIFTTMDACSHYAELLSQLNA